MFTVAIPSFNHRAYLPAALLSAIRSPLVTAVLVVDDGSTDGSPALLQWLGGLDRRIRVLPSMGNRGAHARLNELVAAADTEWVAVLNSDDTFVPGRFEAVQTLAAKHRADLIFGDLLLIDGQGSRLGERHAIWSNEVAWPPRWDMDGMVRARQWVPLLSLQNIIATTTNMVFTKRLHAQLGGFRDYRYCHDWDFALRAALTARVAYVPAMLSQYRLHASNTIKEAAGAVRSEVRRMLGAVARDLPAFWTEGYPAASHYQRAFGPAPLSIVLSDTVAAGVLAQEAAVAQLPVTIVATGGETGPAPYVYAPGPAGTAALRLTDVRTILLALATAGHDALLLNRSADGDVTEAGLADALVLRRAAAGMWRTGAVRSIRLYSAAETAPGSVVAVPTDTPGLALPSPMPVSIHVSAPLPVPPPVPVPMPAATSNDPRPVVFVLPAFLAVGGVERLTIATMRALADRWRFVLVTTEPLRPEQGSLHGEAMALATVYDLAEIAGPGERIAALATLRDWYDPALIWIMNGAPWQVDHAVQIRAVFRGIPIVDNQVYDSEAGWVAYLSEPGVRDSDRYVAINRAIAQVMETRHGISPDRIDLIYHGADMSRTVRRPMSGADIAALRRQFGLDPSRPVFGMIGRLSLQKRPLDLAALAQRIGPRVQFVWVGSGELQDEVAATAPANFHMLSNQADVRPIYELLDGLVITSAFEGLPVVLIEAMAMGLPTLSTDVGAIAEVLARYGSGTIWGPVGDIDALTTAFKAFRRALPGLRAAAVAAADQVQTDFSSARMAGEYEACWLRAIADASSPGYNQPACSNPQTAPKVSTAMAVMPDTATISGRHP